MGYFGWAPYVPVAQRRMNAQKKLKALEKKGLRIEPVQCSGRSIAKSFWGQAWCDNLERYSDFENRVPRGRTYVRNGSVVHLAISPGEVRAYVAGSELYSVTVTISKLAKARWGKLKRACSGGFGSLVELLQGKFSKEVMQIVAAKGQGLFPEPKEIKMKCSCPDYASMCKHVAAVLYGIGARLDTAPELLFKLREVSHEELIATSGSLPIRSAGTSQEQLGDLGALFDIEIANTGSDEKGPQAAKLPPARKTARSKKIKGKVKTTKAAVVKRKIPRNQGKKRKAVRR